MAGEGFNPASLVAQLVGAGVIGGSGVQPQNTITKGANAALLGLTDVNAGQGLTPQGVSPMAKNVPVMMSGMGKPNNPMSAIQQAIQNMGDAFLRSIANTGIQNAPVDSNIPILNSILPRSLGGRGFDIT